LPAHRPKLEKKRVTLDSPGDAKGMSMPVREKGGESIVNMATSFQVQKMGTDWFPERTARKKQGWAVTPNRLGENASGRTRQN